MSKRIEDYALLGNGLTAALVSLSGSVDWLCLPRFDSPACLAALLGTAEHGSWRIAPVEPCTSMRAYRHGTLILETLHRSPAGEVIVIDYMPVGEGQHLVRIVEGRRGTVAMEHALVLRPEYGSTRPRIVRTENGEIRLLAGPDKVILRAGSPVVIDAHTVTARFSVAEGERVSFALSHAPSHAADPAPIEPLAALARSTRRSLDWSRRFAGGTPWDEAVLRSLLTLKALIYQPTGGIVAAPTTSLPESVGGARNWDYRFCWLRDSAFTLTALLDAGFTDEALAWHDWLLRAAASVPEEVRILYGLAGERLIPEIELDWLPGYETSRPVRIGNGASGQFQLDVFGEVVDAIYQARCRGMERDEDGPQAAQTLLTYLENVWHKPDEGIWEVRGGPRHFVHSKVMAWVAFDRAVRLIENHDRAARWASIRDEIHAEICASGFDPELNSFVQSYGSKRLDASLLLLMHVGFLPPSDPRLIGTVAAIGKGLIKDGFVLRYTTEGEGVDGLAGAEGAFLPCSFWYADNLMAQGRMAEARAWLERLIGVANDVGLLAEEYDPGATRLLGNFPQAFSHVALVNSVFRFTNFRCTQHA